MANEIFHECRSAGRSFTSEEWSEYCRASRMDDGKRLVTRIGKHDFNDCDICLNPNVLTMALQGKWMYYVTLKWADCGNGLWSWACDYNTGTGGGGSGVGFAWKPFDEKNTNHYGEGVSTELEAKMQACEEALRHLLNAYTKNDKVERLILMVEEYKTKLKPKYVQLELFDF